MSSSGVPNVKSDFGAIGDYVTDDTPAFLRMMTAWQGSLKVEPVTTEFHVASLPLRIPPGIYLITASVLTSSFTTVTFGMIWDAEDEYAAIAYHPASSGPLFNNVNAILGLRFRNLNISCNDAGSDFIDSASSGQAQDYGFENTNISGTWRYGLYLTGTNNNSEMFWNNCAISGTYTAFLYTSTSDQFLNYWFNQCRIDSLGSGSKFINAPFGGHFKINECDFSGYNTQTVTHFNLTGNNHAGGVCSFVCRGSRFEVGQNLTVMYCEWGSGIVIFDGCDFSSQAYQAWSQTVVAFSFSWGNQGGPQVSFRNCDLMGIHNYTVGGASWMTKKSVVYENCDSASFIDFYAMFTTSLSPSGINTFPPIKIQDCRGAQTASFLNSSLQAVTTVWAANTAYTLNQIVAAGTNSAGVFNNWWAYKCTVAGTSGTQVPFGTGTVTDGGVTWVAVGGNWSFDFITDGGVTFNSTTQRMSGAKHVATLSFANGGLGSRAQTTTPGYAKIVLPPYAIVTKVEIYYAPGSSNQTGTATFSVFADGAAGASHTFLSFTNSSPSSGFTQTWSGDSPGYYSCGNTIQTRTIVLQAGTDVTTNVGNPSYCIVEYISGE